MGIQRLYVRKFMGRWSHGSVDKGDKFGWGAKSRGRKNKDLVEAHKAVAEMSAVTPRTISPENK